MNTSVHPANKKLSESEAIRLAQQGDPAAFEFLYRLHSRKVFGICLRMAVDRSEAEDLTQETFLTIFRKIQGYRGESAFSTWLHRVTVNTILMRFRKKNIPSDSLDEPSDWDENGSKIPLQLGERDLQLSGTIDRLNLERAIDQLAPGCKMMFLLHDVEGYRHEEIAALAGCTVGNSKSQLHKARVRLREILSSPVRRLKKRRSRRLAAHGPTHGETLVGMLLPQLPKSISLSLRHRQRSAVNIVPAKNQSGFFPPELGVKLLIFWI
jgi:RNA polymerase sigma-70 factor (ECF subfamily)